jgi:hypothetical protein
LYIILCFEIIHNCGKNNKKPEQIQATGKQNIKNSNKMKTNNTHTKPIGIHILPESSGRTLQQKNNCSITAISIYGVAGQ